MILFLNRNDPKWPHTRRIKIAGRNHILPPLGIAWKIKQGHDFFLCWCYVLSVTSKVLVPVKYLSSKTWKMKIVF